MALRALAFLPLAGTFAVLGACESTEESPTLGGAGTGSAGTRGVMIGVSGTAGGGGTASGGGSSGAATGEAGGKGDGATACETLAGLDQCGGMRVEAEPAKVQVLLVIDKSGSMTDRPDGFAVDKWSAMTEALGAALSSAPESVSFGLLTYPDSVFEPIPLDCDGDLCCNVPDAAGAVRVDIGPDRADAIEQALLELSPGGGTPTAAALERALDYFTSGAGLLLEGDKYVLLATDGGPNCNADLSCDATACTPNLDGAEQCAGTNCCEGAGAFCLDDGSVTSRIEALQAAGIATFVVGIPGSEAYTTYLDEFARAGGVPLLGASHDYYAVSASSGVSGLTGVLKGITTKLLRSCEVALAEPPGQPSLVNVAIDCKVLPQNGDDSGWEFDDAVAPTGIVIRGRACDELNAEGARRIDVVYGCTTIR